MAEILEDNCKISRCLALEEDGLVDFLKKYWKEDHIFVTSPSLLRWQHLDGPYLNFIIARDLKTNRIMGIFGFIPTSKFDKGLTNNNDTWGAIWKVTDDAPFGLGLRIMQFFHNEINPASHGSIGNTDIALSLYKLTKQKTGILNQYFILSDSAANFTIAKPGKIKTDKGLQDASVIQELSLSPDISLAHRYHPKKTITYLINRYQEHPIYKYRFFGAYSQNELQAIFVVRKQFSGTSSCLRLVDIYGNVGGVRRSHDQLQELMRKEEAEYIDCYNYGISEEVFVQIGFEKLDPAGSIVIPNYFEPFEQRNVVINFAVKTQYPDYVVFRADGDQDRPSILSKA